MCVYIYKYTSISSLWGAQNLQNLGEMRYAMAATSMAPISPTMRSLKFRRPWAVPIQTCAPWMWFSTKMTIKVGGVCKPTPWRERSVGWIYRDNPLFWWFLFTCMIVCHLLDFVGLKCIDCRYFWNPFFVIMACGYKPPPNPQAPSMAGKRAKPVPEPSSMPWKRLPRQPSSLLLLAPLASLLWVTSVGHLCVTTTAI